MINGSCVGVNKRIGLFVLYPYIGISHSIISMAEFLKQRGWEVDIFTVRQRLAQDILPQDLLLMERPDIPRWVRFPLNLLYFVLWSLRKCRRKHYQCFIGYDPPGLTVASVVGLIRGVPVIYHSLELWVSKDLVRRSARLRWLPSQQMMFKYAERLSHRRAIFTIIQDKRRAKVLFGDNHLAPGETYYVPHVGREGLYKPDSNPDYLRWKFGIESQKCILLMVGGINSTTLAREVAETTNNWLSSWHLVLHGFGSPGYLDLISQSTDRDRVTLSTELVSMTELADLVASADIGLALYPHRDTNCYEMTSGKIGQYFRCGMPVIANDFPSLVDVVEVSGAGLCVHSVDEVPAAINRIMKDYDEFHQNSYRAYLKYYDFDRAFEPVFRRIEEIEERKMNEH